MILQVPAHAMHLPCCVSDNSTHCYPLQLTCKTNELSPSADSGLSDCSVQLSATLSQQVTASRSQLKPLLTCVTCLAVQVTCCTFSLPTATYLQYNRWLLILDVQSTNFTKSELLESSSCCRPCVTVLQVR